MPTPYVAVGALLVFLAACSPSPAPSSQTAAPRSADFDVLIAGGRILDGTGAPWYAGDVGIVGDRITAVGPLGSRTATTRIDAAGSYVAPGFIDMLGQSELNVLADGRAASKITQGVTTEITGEGSAIAPLDDRLAAEAKPSFDALKVTLDFRTLGEYFARLETRSRPAINLGSFVGAGGLRGYVIGDQQRVATSQELDRMKTLVREAMQQGALGISTSLQYVPDRFASTEEIVELAKVAAEYGGRYLSHQRSESNKILDSLNEAFTVAEQARIPTEIWHLKTAYRANWGRMPEVLRHIESARARGLDVTANMYPYDRASNGLDACLPLWVRDGGTEAMIARLKDPAQRERVKRDMEDPNPGDWENQWYGSGGAGGVLLSSVLDPSLRKWEGKTLLEIGKEMGTDPRDAVMDLVIADRAESSVIISIMREDDVRAALAHPMIAIGTDSGARAEDGPLSISKSHPRAWGSFTKILGTYVRDEKLVSLEDAVRRFTSRPAARIGITDRGLLRPGMKADITIFDLAQVRDRSTYTDPTHYSEGIRHVLVNGQAVVRDGRITEARPGQVIRGAGYGR
ncbi:MAG TPA: D-aminoacylase [Vicinamibacterales bacterium]|nr:D-aminoacylase [Vicinamibacterales bacterium]